MNNAYANKPSLRSCEGMACFYEKNGFANYSIGLGMVSGDSGQENQLQAFKMVFGINIFICIGVIIMMVSINRWKFKST